MRLGRSLLLAGVVVVGHPLGAQVRVPRDAELRAGPNGNVVATVVGGTSWRTGVAREGWTLVTLEGWIAASRLAGRRDSFPESIGGTSTLRIRAEPSLNGRILGEFQPLAGLHVLERRGTWARIRRDAWVQTSALATATTATTATAPRQASGTTPPPRPAAGASAPAPRAAAEAPATAAARSPLRADATVALRTAPGGEELGRVEPGTVVEPIARERGWVRVRVDAWVPESLFVPADTTYAHGLSAADLRLDPTGHRGRIVRWPVQVVGLQKADVFRGGLAEDEPYLLATGPGSENVVLYLVVPPALLSEVRDLPALARVVVTARVRTGRSEPTGVPILEIISIRKM